MYKEPIGLYIFRFLFSLGMFAFWGMLYWSSLVVEENIIQMRSEITELKNEIFSLRTDIGKFRDNVMKVLLEGQKKLQDSSKEDHNKENAVSKPSEILTHPPNQAAAPAPNLQKAFQNRKHINPFYPNLLHDDPFYEVTLPKMLGRNFKPHGVFHGDSLGRPDNLNPFSNWSQVSDWQGQCIPSLSKLQFGKYETFAPDMAIKIEERKMKDSAIPEFWVHLRDQVFWQPLSSALFSENINLAPQFLRKHQVTAHDFKFYYDALMNPFLGEAGAVALRNYYDDVKELEIIDDLTFIVRWKEHTVKEPDGKIISKIKYQAKFLTGGLRPLASFVYKYFPDGKKIVEDDSDPNTYRTNSVWAANFSQHWAQNIIPSCGPWVFDGMTERSIKFKRNRDYYFPYAVLAEGDEVQFRDSMEGVWEDFQAGKVDSYSLQPNQLIEYADFLKSPQYQEQAKHGNSIKRLDYLARSYNYIGWNEAKPFFSSKKVRQALTMAIDRKRIIDEYLNGMGIEVTGTFYRYSPSYDKDLIPWPYDPDAAKRLLNEEGWYDREGTGVIEKVINGKKVPFNFTLMYFVKNATGKAICEYVSTALKELGIICNLNGVDVADLSAAFDDKSFDAIFLGWALGNPPEDPKQLWYSAGAKEKGSSNAIGFANAEVDRIIDQLEYEYDEKKREQLYRRFDEIIYDECPYTFLYSPKTAFIYRDYLQNVFIPRDRQDLIPGANIAEPDSSIFWLKH